MTVRGFLEAIVNRSTWKSSGLAAWKEPVGNIRVSAAVLLVCVGLGVAPAAAATCEDLASLKLPDTTITLAQSVAAGWDGCPKIPAPGFPQDGRWQVRCEGISSAL